MLLSLFLITYYKLLATGDKCEDFDESKVYLDGTASCESGRLLLLLVKYTFDADENILVETALWNKDQELYFLEADRK